MSLNSQQVQTVEYSHFREKDSIKSTKITYITSVCIVLKQMQPCHKEIKTLLLLQKINTDFTVFLCLVII